MRKVKIINCQHHSWWYKDLVGKVIKIKDNELNEDYIATLTDIDVPLTNGYLLKDDCYLISE